VTSTVHRTVSVPVLRDGLATGRSETTKCVCVDCAKQSLVHLERLGLSNPLAGF
jgi:hypothetical protein